jgi:DNA-binding FrmR family transcriptional regulator
MESLDNNRHRTDILNRLKRAEGQLRGIQRMVEEQADCLAVATQMAAVRKALDSTYLHMVRCQMEQHLHAQLGHSPDAQAQVAAFVEQMEGLMAKLR